MQFDTSGFGRIRVPALLQLGSALTLAATVQWGLADTATRDSSYGSVALWAQVGTWAALVAAVIAVVALLMPLPRLERRAVQVVMASLPPMLIAGLSVMLGTAAAMGGVTPVFIGVLPVST